MRDTSESGPEIVTEGSGWFEQPGDRAELDVSLTATARTRSDAVRALGVKVRMLDVPVVGAQVVRYRRLWVRNEWRADRIVGCRAGEDIGLLLGQPEQLEETLAAIIAAEPTDLHGPRWILSDRAAAYREAQRRAVADARERAEGYATALDARLGPLRLLTEVPEHDGTPMIYQMAARESAAPDIRELGLEPESVRVTARCTTRWALLLPPTG